MCGGESGFERPAGRPAHVTLVKPGGYEGKLTLGAVRATIPVMAAIAVGNTFNQRLQGLSQQRFDTPEQLCAELAKLFCVRRDEVALLRLQGRMLHFVYPAELRAAGAIPLSSSAVAARTAAARKAEVFNSFVRVKHSSIFEMVKLGSQDTTPDPEVRVIQKLMSAPVLGKSGEVVGVLQISRKGATLAAAGPDFSPDELQLLEAAGDVVGRRSTFFA